MLHNGVLVEIDQGETELVSYDFKDGADVLGINRRTLDDYWFNVQRGFMFNFNFGWRLE